MSRPAHLHLSVRVISRTTGRSALAAAEYIARRGRYSRRELDRCMFTDSLNMPAWARGARHAPAYWKAADTFERANGRLATSVIFTLPRGLNARERRELAEAYVSKMARTAEGRPLPATFAIHSGGGSNPHVHVLVSERVADGLDRDAAHWFRREATGRTKKDRGGAKKTRDLMARDWIPTIRKLLSDLTNAALRAAGRPPAELVDHRSHKQLGLDTVPGRHFGPAAAAMHRAGRGRRVREVLDDAEACAAAARELQDIATEIAGAERELAQVQAAKDLPSITNALQSARKDARRGDYSQRQGGKDEFDIGPSK